MIGVVIMFTVFAIVIMGLYLKICINREKHYRLMTKWYNKFVELEMNSAV